MKLTVEYDPKHGYVLPDGRVEEYVDKVITAFFNQNDNQKITVACALFVDFFRLRLCEGVIKTDQIEFMFEDKILRHNKYATMEHWPKGYCDIPIEPVEKLLTCGAKLAKLAKEKRDAQHKENKKAHGSDHNSTE
jgi:hypothetical protein